MRTHHQAAAHHGNTTATAANIHTSLRQHFWHDFITTGQFRTTGKKTATFTGHRTVHRRTELNVLVNVDQIITAQHTHAFIARQRNALCSKTDFRIRFLHISVGIGVVGASVGRCQ